MTELIKESIVKIVITKTIDAISEEEALKIAIEEIIDNAKEDNSLEYDHASVRDRDGAGCDFSGEVYYYD